MGHINKNNFIEKLPALEKQLLAIHKALFYKTDIIFFDKLAPHITKEECNNFITAIRELDEQSKKDK